MASVEAARVYWERMMQERKYEFQSEFARKYVAVGREEGRAEGLRLALRRQWTAKFGAPSREQSARISSAAMDVLERWLDRILVVDSAERVTEDE